MNYTFVTVFSEINLSFVKYAQLLLLEILRTLFHFG